MSDTIESCERCGEPMRSEDYEQAERDVQTTMRLRKRWDMPPVCAVCLEDEIGESRAEDLMYDYQDDMAAMKREES